MISIVFGTRPEIVKLFPVINLFQKKKIKFNLIHTGQHYTDNLSKIFIDQLKIPKKKIINLNVGSNSHAKQTSIMTMEIEKYLYLNKNIKAIIVYGDTNSALAGALAAVKFDKIKLVHLEAGLRSFDKEMPEEINRRIIDHISDILLCPTELSKKFLSREGINKKKIFLIGNTIMDTIKSKIVQKNLINYSKKITTKRFGILTIHREENTKNFKNLKIILDSIIKFSKKNNLKFIFPAHPKTMKLLKKNNFQNEYIDLVSPMNYFNFLAHLKASKIAISDSGGIQEEACILRIPLVTVRNSTERQETIKIGSNILCKLHENDLFSSANKILKKKIKWRNPYGSGNSSVNVYKIILRFLKLNDKKFY